MTERLRFPAWAADAADAHAGAEPASPASEARRQALRGLSATLGGIVARPLLAAGALLTAGAVRASVPTDRVTVLYRRESAQAPSRLEPAIQAATLALEQELIKRDYKVLQPSAEIYQLMDQGQAVVVTFAEDAGFSLVYSAYADVRPLPGQDSGIAEVRLSTRVFVGRHILVADEGRGQVSLRLDAATREFAMRRGLEVAARRAANDLAEKASATLKAVTPERINQLVGPRPTTSTTSQVVAVPMPGAPLPANPSAAGQAGPTAPPPLAPVAPAAPAPAPSAAPAPVPAPAAAAPAPAPAPAAAPAPAPAAPAELPSPRLKWALVVGMSDYSSVRAATGGRITDLPGVARDTRFVVESLRKLGFAPERTRVLRDAQATGANVRAVLKELAAKTQPDDAVLIFFSAHGADKDASVSGFGMPILADYRPNDPASLDFWELQSFAKNLKGRVLWINDTCHSGGAATNVASVVVSSTGVQASLDVKGPDAKTVAGSAGPGQDFAILTACAPNEISWEDQEGGVFTTRLFRQLLANGGRVPLAKVFAEQVHGPVVERSRQMCRSQGVCAQYPQQTPVMAYNGNGHLIRLA